MKKGLAIFASIIVFVALCIGIALLVIPARVIENKIDYAVNKIDEATRYDLLREVENTARAMVASYKADVLTYTSLKSSTEKSERDMATAARIRANRTATSYNEYILKNSYVWADNVPSDIDRELPLIE